MEVNAQHGKLRGRICSSQQVLTGRMISIGTLRGQAHIPQITAADIYTGPVEVVPGIDGQTLPTQFKTMPSDISVHPIPFAAVSNEFGGVTITIGGV